MIHDSQHFPERIPVLLFSLTIWLVWWLCWLTVGMFSKLNSRRESIRDRLRHFLPLFSGAALIFITVVIDPVILLWDGPASNWLGIGLTLVGLAIACWARYHLGRNWSGLVAIKEHHELVSSGPYGFVRHPIYTGLIVAMTGSAITAGTPGAIAGLCLIVAAFYIKLTHEEQLLMRAFGSRYAELCLRVPSRMFPLDGYLLERAIVSSLLSLSARTRL
jgi:protein-S-isoprenylcysteine O-methyltransferase Ste14